MEDVKASNSENDAMIAKYRQIIAQAEAAIINLENPSPRLSVVPTDLGTMDAYWNDKSRRFEFPDFLDSRVQTGFWKRFYEGSEIEKDIVSAFYNARFVIQRYPTDVIDGVTYEMPWRDYNGPFHKTNGFGAIERLYRTYKRYGIFGIHAVLGYALGTDANVDKMTGEQWEELERAVFRSF